MINWLSLYLQISWILRSFGLVCCYLTNHVYSSLFLVISTKFILNELFSSSMLIAMKQLWSEVIYISVIFTSSVISSSSIISLLKLVGVFNGDNSLILSNFKYLLNSITVSYIFSSILSPISSSIDTVISWAVWFWCISWMSIV